MYSELFDQLGANSRLSRGGDPNSAGNDEPAPLVSFKAGKMELKQLETPGQFECAPIKTRGEVRLVWKDSCLTWQWYDRREKKVQDDFKVQPNSTFERVPLDDKAHQQDRIYVWTRPADADDKHLMYWMQDASEEKEDETMAQVNAYLADPKSAAPAGETVSEDRMDTENSTTTGQNATAGTTTGEGQSQVDALSTILENLGMPQGTGEAAPANASANATLTLADLQGAMAGIQQQPPASAPPVLSELVTSGAITGLLADEAACQRLLELLPEEQRTLQHLEDNLRSPQVQQTLRTLTSTMMPDDSGDLSGLYSVLANFQLDPVDGQDAVTKGNPIQAFLDCLIESAKKEKEEKGEGEEEQKEE
jgi:26S proteasome regulatory subunit N13